MSGQRQGGWIPVYSDLTRHEKTQRAADLLRLKQHGPQAVAGYLVTLWNRAAQERVPVPAGGPIADRVVEHWAEWEGKRGALLEALVAAGFIDRRDDGLYLHGWEDGGGRSVRQRDRWVRNKRNGGAEFRAESNAEPSEEIRAGVRETDQTRPDQRDPDPDLSGDPRNHARAKGPRREAGSASPAEPEPAPELVTVRDAGVAAYLAAHDRMLSTWGPRDDEHRRRVVASSCASDGCLAEHVRTAERSLSDRDVWPQPPRQPWSAFAKALDHAMASCGLGTMPDADDDDRLESLPLASEALIRDLRDRGELGESMAPPRLRRSI